MKPDNSTNLAMTDDEIRALRRCVSRDSKEWATCTKALHASDPADREMYRRACADIRDRLRRDYGAWP